MPSALLILVKLPSSLFSVYFHCISKSSCSLPIEVTVLCSEPWSLLLFFPLSGASLGTRAAAGSPPRLLPLPCVDTWAPGPEFWATPNPHLSSTPSPFLPIEAPYPHTYYSENVYLWRFIYLLKQSTKSKHELSSEFWLLWTSPSGSWTDLSRGTFV